MTTLDIYRAQYETQKELLGKEYSKYEWAALNIFGLVTYDSGMDELLVKNILEVCKVILKHRNYEYINNENNYLKYIIVCQLLHNLRWIEWGTSIRGAWFEEYNFKPWGCDEAVTSEDILEELEWWDPEHKVIPGVQFSPENLEDLLIFMSED